MGSFRELLLLFVPFLVSLYVVGEAAKCGTSGDLVVEEGTTCQFISGGSYEYDSIKIDGTIEIRPTDAVVVTLTSSGTVSIGSTGAIDANHQGRVVDVVSDPFGGKTIFFTQVSF